MRKASHSWSWPTSFHQLVAAAYRISGDPELGKFAHEIFDYQLKKAVGFNVSNYIPFQIEAFNLREKK